jgi:hypothetical protein
MPGFQLVYVRLTFCLPQQDWLRNHSREVKWQKKWKTQVGDRK